VEEKEESVSLGALGCKIYKEAAEEHFLLTNCRRCQEKIKEKETKNSMKDGHTEEMKNTAQVRVTKEIDKTFQAREAGKCEESVSSDEEYYECYDDPPSEFECGLTGELMTDPVLLPSGEIICSASRGYL
jgi:hypothetical protein